MMNNKAFEIQNSIRQTAIQAQENLENLKQWEKEMKEKEIMEMKKHREQLNEQNQVRIFLC